jgi:hypothetical protein
MSLQNSLDPHTHITAQLRAVHGHVMRLVRERAEEEVAIAKCQCSIQPEHAQLLSAAGIQRQIGFECLVEQEHMSLLVSRMGKMTKHEFHNPVGGVCVTRGPTRPLILVWRWRAG